VTRWSLGQRQRKEGDEGWAQPIGGCERRRGGTGHAGPRAALGCGLGSKRRTDAREEGWQQTSSDGPHRVAKSCASDWDGELRGVFRTSGDGLSKRNGLERGKGLGVKGKGV
jgi:hypothetical protein